MGIIEAEIEKKKKREKVESVKNSTPSCFHTVVFIFV